jgi:hypothetical protein
MADFEASQINMPDVDSQILSSLPPVGDLTSEESQSGLYRRYIVQTKFIQNAGRLVIPVGSGPSLGARIAQVSNSWGYRLVMWYVERNTLPPDLPAVEESDNSQLLRAEITISNDVLDAQNSVRTYRRGGYYLFAMKRPLTIGSDEASAPSLPGYKAPSPSVTSDDFTAGVAPVSDPTE